MNNDLKKWIGPLAYGVAAFKAFSQRRPIHFKLTYKDAGKSGQEIVREFKSLQVAIANGRCFGGGIVSAPDATLDDSLLAVTVMGEMGLLELARIVPGLMDGSYVKHPKVEHFNTTEVLVETRRPHRVNLDGPGLPAHAPAFQGNSKGVGSLRTPTAIIATCGRERTSTFRQRC